MNVARFKESRQAAGKIREHIRKRSRLQEVSLGIAQRTATSFDTKPAERRQRKRVVASVPRSRVKIASKSARSALSLSHLPGAGPVKRIKLNTDSGDVGVIHHNIDTFHNDVEDFSVVEEKGERVIRIRYKEWIKSFSYTAAQAALLSTGPIMTLGITPTCPFLPRLGLSGKMFERWKLRRAIAEWVPACGSTTGGQFAMGFLMDPSSEIVGATGDTWIRAITETSGGLVFGTFTPASTSITPNAEDQWLYNVDDDGSDRWMVAAVLSLGIAAVPGANATGTTTYGSLYLDYEIDFEYPKLYDPDSSPPTTADITMTFGTGAITKGDSLFLINSGGASDQRTGTLSASLDTNYIYQMTYLSTTTNAVLGGFLLNWVTKYETIADSLGTGLHWNSGGPCIQYGIVYVKFNGVAGGFNNFVVYGDADCTLPLKADSTRTTTVAYVGIHRFTPLRRLGGDD